MRRSFSSISSVSSAVQNSFHKRALPSSLIAFNSPQGKQIFREALDMQGMESYFSLAEQFLTQSEPQYCSLSSLAMVLNALNHDPKRVWRKPWRWVTEDMLACETRQVCGHSLEKVVSSGLDFNEFESLTRCHGVNVSSQRAHSHEPDPHLAVTIKCDGGLELFRRVVQETSQSSGADAFIIANYSRAALGQTGDGHFSPIGSMHIAPLSALSLCMALGGYHKQKDLVLVLDVARFKYPPHWVRTWRT